MSNDNNDFDFLNLGNDGGFNQTLSFYKKDTINPIYFESKDSSELSINSLLRRLISVTVSSLSYREHFENLYNDDLIGILTRMMKEGRLKGVLLVIPKKDKASGFVVNTAYRFLQSQEMIDAFKKEKQYKTYTLIDVDIKVSQSLYSIIKYYLEALNTLSAITVSSINISKSMTLKLADFRKNTPSSYLSKVEESVKGVLSDVSDGTKHTIILDAGDSLEQTMEDTSTFEQNMQNVIFGRLSLITGFPLSFFSGIFQNSIGSTNAGEREMLYNAKLTMYHTYLAPFFKLINNAIDIKLDLNTGSVDPNVINIAEMHSDIVDLEEVLRMYNFPLLKDKQKDENFK